jgi:hypothetical protein
MHVKMVLNYTVGNIKNNEAKHSASGEMGDLSPSIA